MGNLLRFVLLAVLASSHGALAHYTLKKLVGEPSYVRAGKSTVFGTQDVTKEVVLIENDLIKVPASAGIILSQGPLTIQAAPGTVLQLNAPGTPEKPALLTLIVGHIRVTVRKGAGLPAADKVRVRTPRGLVGLKNLGDGGAEVIIHVTRTEEEFYAKLQSNPPAIELPSVENLNDMNLFPKLYTRLDVAVGNFIFKANESDTVHDVQAGSFMDHVPTRNEGEPSKSPILVQERLKIRRALGI